MFDGWWLYDWVARGKCNDVLWIAIYRGCNLRYKIEWTLRYVEFSLKIAVYIEIINSPVRMRVSTATHNATKHNKSADKFSNKLHYSLGHQWCFAVECCRFFDWKLLLGCCCCIKSLKQKPQQAPNSIRSIYFHSLNASEYLSRVTFVSVSLSLSRTLTLSLPFHVRLSSGRSIWLLVLMPLPPYLQRWAHPMLCYHFTTFAHINTLVHTKRSPMLLRCNFTCHPF